MKNSSEHLPNRLRGPFPARRAQALILGVLLVAAAMAAVESRAAPSSTSLRLRAYATLVLADEARDQGEWESAHASYTEALDFYRALAEEDPKWQPDIVSYRVRYCTEALDEVAARLTPSEEPETTGAQAVAGEVTQAYEEQVRALTQENEYLRGRIESLEEELDLLTESGDAGEDDGGAGADLEDAESEIADVKAAFDAYRADTRASVSNLQATLADVRLESEETRQANLDLIRQLEVAAEEHQRMSTALEEAGLEEVPVIRDETPVLPEEGEAPAAGELPEADEPVPPADPAEPVEDAEKEDPNLSDSVPF